MRAAAFAFVLYAALLVVSAPASLLAWALTAGTKGVAILENARGGLWRGEANALVIVDPSGKPHRYERVRWEWLGSRLVSGELALRFQVTDIHLRAAGRLALGPDGPQLGHVALRMPASSLSPYIPRLSLAVLSGEIVIQAEEFVIGKDQLHGVATVQWRNAATALGGASPFGDYQAFIAGTGPRAEFRVTTLSGALHLEGRGAWSPAEALSFKGTAKATAERRAELTGLLNLLGPDRGTGVHEVDFPVRR